MTTWSIGLFECYKAKHIDVQFYFTHCCCGPCVRAQALKEAGVANAVDYAIYGVAGSVLASSNNNTVRTVGQATQTAAYAKARSELAKKYKIEEPVLVTILASFCCPLCAQIQEVDTVVTNENLTYNCGSLVKLDDDKESPIAPKTQHIKRHSQSSRLSLSNL